MKKLLHAVHPVISLAFYHLFKNPDEIHNLRLLLKPTSCTQCLLHLVFNTVHYKKDS